MELQVLSMSKRLKGEKDGYRLEATAADIAEGTPSRVDGGQVYDEAGQYVGWFSSDSSSITYGLTEKDREKRSLISGVIDDFIEAVNSLNA